VARSIGIPAYYRDKRFAACHESFHMLALVTGAVSGGSGYPADSYSLVSLSDPGVIPPVLDKKPVLAYPPIALRQRAEGTVDLNLLVDERGYVTDAQVVAAPGGRAGLPEAAQEYARRWRYRPATKDGVPVKVWTPVRVRFELPK
jgi:protein TonB